MLGWRVDRGPLRYGQVRDDFSPRFRSWPSCHFLLLRDKKIIYFTQRVHQLNFETGVVNVMSEPKNITRIGLLRRCWVTFVAYTIGVYASTLNRFRISGEEHLPRSGGVLIASNHISGYETVFLPWALLRKHPLQMIWAPAKEELFEKPFLRWFFTSLGAFPVKRGRDVRAGKALQDLLKTEKVMIFPEGTRSTDGTLGKGNRGVGKLIYEVRPIVVPTVLTGLNRWKFPGFGQTGSVRFGAPLELSDLYALPDEKETYVLIVDRVMAAIAGLLTEETTAFRD